MEDTPEHLIKYNDVIPITDVIAGPLDVQPMKGSTKFNIPNYEDVVNLFNEVVNVDRNAWLNKSK